MSAEAHHAVLARHGRTFAAATAWLPRDLADDIATLYAFCRAADDAIDEHDDVRGAERMRADLIAGRSEVPIVADLLEVIERRGLPTDAAVELVDGALSDVGDVRVADVPELVRYGWRVAGTVGVLVSALFGCPESARPFAIDLGIGMQLTNIARDVAEDARRDRVYLPATLVQPAAVLRGDEEVVGAVHAVLELAERYYASGHAGLRYLPWRARVAVSLASHRYRAIGRKVARLGVAALRERTVVGRLEIARELVTGLAVAVLAPLWPAREHDSSLQAPLRVLPRALAAGAAA